MKTVLISIFAGITLVGIAAAQGTAMPNAPASQPQGSAPAQPTPQTAPTQSPAPPAGAPTRIAPGSVIPVSLTKTIDAKKAKTGDEVVAKVTQDMKSTSGEVLVPKDTKVMGHVTEAQPRNKEQKESQVGIVFDRAVMKDGSAMQMPMSIQAIIGEQGNDQNNDQNGGGGNSGATVRSSSPGATGGTRSGMGGSAPAPAPSSTSTGDNLPNSAPTGKNSRPPITAQTEGVVGISDLKLNPTASNAAEGSVVSSDKNNVKLESGTMILLRVSQ